MLLRCRAGWQGSTGRCAGPRRWGCYGPLGSPGPGCAGVGRGAGSTALSMEAGQTGKSGRIASQSELPGMVAPNNGIRGDHWLVGLELTEWQYHCDLWQSWSAVKAPRDRFPCIVYSPRTFTSSLYIYKRIPAGVNLTSHCRTYPFRVNLEVSLFGAQIPENRRTRLEFEIPMFSA
jgi:hypothetical protein